MLEYYVDNLVRLNARDSRRVDVVDWADRTHILLQRAQCGWRVPEDVDARTAAAAPVGGVTSYYAKHHGILAGRNQSRLVSCQLQHCLSALTVFCIQITAQKPGRQV
jgi:hypothetical protein